MSSSHRLGEVVLIIPQSRKEGNDRAGGYMRNDLQYLPKDLASIMCRDCGKREIVRRKDWCGQTGFRRRCPTCDGPMFRVVGENKPGEVTLLVK